MDIEVFSGRPSLDFEIGAASDLSFTVVSDRGSVLVTSAEHPQTITSLESSNFVTIPVAISANGGDVYGPPYFSVSNDEFRFFSWAATSGEGWLARRISREGFLQTELQSPAGAQPASIQDFEELSWP